MQIFENLKMAIQAVTSNKMRSILTMLGIIIGISSVITLVSLGKGSQQKMRTEFETLGVNRAYIYINYNDEYDESNNITEQDIAAIKRVYSQEIEGLTPSNEMAGVIQVGKKAINVDLKGVTEEYQKVDNFKMIKGRFLVSSDIDSLKASAVIDKDMAMRIYGTTDVIGKRFYLETDYESFSYIITGVYTKPKSSFGSREAFTAFVPYTNISLNTGMDSYSALEFNIKDGLDKKTTLSRIVTLIEKRHDTKGKKNYLTFNSEKEMATLNKFMNTMTLLVSAIAGISLLVGGIGIMNIMLVSVTERTREIGIRKAIGANRINIMTQFLIESIIVSAIGGAIGIGLGYALANIIGKYAKITPVITSDIIILALGFCAVIGIFFGLYPAKRASDLNPIDALRYE